MKNQYKMLTDVKNWYQKLTEVKNCYQIITNVKSWYLIFTNVNDRICNIWSRVKDSLYHMTSVGPNVFPFAIAYNES